MKQENVSELPTLKNSTSYSFKKERSSYDCSPLDSQEFDADEERLSNTTSPTASAEIHAKEESLANTPRPSLQRATNEYHEKFEGIPLQPRQSTTKKRYKKTQYTSSPPTLQGSIEGEEIKETEESGQTKDIEGSKEIVKSEESEQSAEKSVRTPSSSALASVDEREKYSSLKTLHRSPMSMHVPVRPLEEANILATYGPATRRLLLFDYDGTLTPIVKDPASATVPKPLLAWFEQLASEPKNAVWVISGRDQSFLELQLGGLVQVGLVAEHGAFMRRPICNEWENVAAKTDMSWQSEVLKAFQEIVNRYIGFSIERKKVAVVLHYRLLANEPWAAMEAAKCKARLEKTVATRWPVEIVNGKCVIEARPANVDKGQIAQRITDELRHAKGGPPDFVLCAGDDVTDEDMFRALRASDLPEETVFTVTIGESTKNSDADWFLTEPTDVFATIKMLNACDSTGDVQGKGPLRPDGSYRGSQLEIFDSVAVPKLL